MQIQKYVQHIEVTEAIVFDGTEDLELAEWVNGTLAHDGPEGTWTLTFPSGIGEVTAQATDVVFRSENGTMGWGPFTKWSLADFNVGFDPAQSAGFAQQGGNIEPETPPEG